MATVGVKKLTILLSSDNETTPDVSKHYTRQPVNIISSYNTLVCYTGLHSPSMSTSLQPHLSIT